MQYPWDRADTLVEVRLTDVRSALNRALGDTVSLRELEEWANHVEVRDDLSFQSGTRHVIHVLANPDLHGGLTRATVVQLLQALASPHT
jgi:hypothetical protein